MTSSKTTPAAGDAPSDGGLDGGRSQSKNSVQSDDAPPSAVQDHAEQASTLLKVDEGNYDQ